MSVQSQTDKCSGVALWDANLEGEAAFVSRLENMIVLRAAVGSPILLIQWVPTIYDILILILRI